MGSHFYLIFKLKLYQELLEKPKSIKAKIPVSYKLLKVGDTFVPIFIFLSPTHKSKHPLH